MTTPYDATVQHLQLLCSKVARIADARRQTEDQLIHRAATDYRAGRITATDVYALYQACRGLTLGASWRDVKQGSTAGFRERWNAAMPDELKAGRLQWTAVHYAPDPDGNWRGEYPFTADTRTPTKGCSVVYVLFDSANAPCYVGSTSQFRTRMHTHVRDGKRFARWIAHPCPDREAAYRLEDRLLREHAPYLNRKAGR